MGKRVVRLVKGILADKPARAVAAIVTDIERLVTIWRWREFLGWNWIVAVVVSCEIGVFLNLLPCSLGIYAEQRKGKKNKQQDVFFHFYGF